MKRSSTWLFPAIIWLFFTYTLGQAQDTIRIMQYNLLQYGGGAVPVQNKNSWLSTIVNHIQPDLLGCNEIIANGAYVQNIKVNVLSSNWESGVYSNLSQSDIVSMLFFRTDLFGLAWQKNIKTNLRDLNIYTLYYKEPGLNLPNADTLFLTIAVVHLKASQGYENERNQHAQMLMDTLNALAPEYLIVMGDLNLYSSNEPAYQTFITYYNPLIRLNDPLQRPGNWSQNPSFADIHTQSTRTTDLGDGGSTGGFNDRFDFILFNSKFWDQFGRIQIIPSSYTTFGQDGNRFNQSLLNPPNNSAPSSVLQAAYQMSDHLPIYCDFIIYPATTSIDQASPSSLSLSYQNPISQSLKLNFSKLVTRATFNLYSLTGNLLLSYSIPENTQTFSIPMSTLPNGIYFFQIKTPNFISPPYKLMIWHGE